MWTCSFLDISPSIPWGVYGRKGHGKWAIKPIGGCLLHEAALSSKVPSYGWVDMASRVKALPKGPRSANMNEDPPTFGFTGELSTYWASSPQPACDMYNVCGSIVEHKGHMAVYTMCKIMEQYTRILLNPSFLWRTDTHGPVPPLWQALWGPFTTGRRW